MDIEYLLYLQQFRETVGSILTPLMNAVTKLSAGFLPIAMMCMIYWAFDQLLIFIEWRFVVPDWYGIVVSFVTESVFVVCQRLWCDSAQHRANSCSHVGDADHTGDLVLAILVD